MPSIPPRAVRVRPWLGGGAAQDWPSVYIHDGSGWMGEGEFTYVREDSGWELAWAKNAGSPATAAAVYETTPDTQVTVTWVASSPAIADTYRVRRADGSLVGTVSSSTFSLVDTSPRPLDGTYRVHGVLGGQEGPATHTNTLDLRLQPASAGTAVVSGGTASSTVNITWTHNALGRPDQYKVLRNGALLTTVAGTSLGTSDPAPLRGQVSVYTVVPVLSTVDGLGLDADDTPVPAAPPTSVALAATNPPLSNLRLTWAAPGGTVTGYEVERSTNGSTWTAHTDDTTPSDWATTVTGWMRVRSVSAGGASQWVVAGPVAPINDVTPPANATITSWKPEASYGRMVVRFTTPNDVDFDSYLVQQRVGAGAWSNVTGWVTAARNTAVAVVCSTRSAGQTAGVRVLVRDADNNQRTGSEVTYLLETTPIRVSPSGSLSGTMRNGAWRNDATRSSTEIATGWTSSGHNIGCFFYGTTIAAELAGKTIVSASVEYYRENEGGLSAAVQPLFWTHQLTTRSGTPTLNSHSLSEAARLGGGVVRSTPNDTATFALPSAFYQALQAGTARGLAMYRGYQGSGDPDSYYALLGIGAVSNNGVINGRITFNHLG